MSEMSENEITTEEVETEETNINSIDPLCNCNDEYRTKPCPVHFADKIQDNFGEDTLVITDLYIVSDQYRSWSGFVFLCPSCKKEAIMVNEDMAKMCCNCGKKVIIRSKIVTDFINKLSTLKKGV